MGRTPGVTAIILAAGRSRRMYPARMKLLMPLGGRPMVEWVIRQVLASQVGEALLVTGCGHREVAEIGRANGVFVVHNPDYAKGLSTSVRAGLRAVPPRTSAAVFVLGDQPFVEAAVLDALIDEYRSGAGSIIVPSYHGVRGNPVLFDMRWAPELMRLDGDQGGKVLLDKHPEDVVVLETHSAGICVDIDTLEDYRAARARWES
ncbi:MAG: nucleotidyltransferase family protein [Syntrophothermus sp.]